MTSIRSAQGNDVGGIEETAQKTWSATYAGIISPKNQACFLENFYSSTALRKAIQQDQSWFFVAEEDEKVVGFAQYVVQENRVGQLTRIYVQPKYQHRGIGKELLNEGIVALKAQGIKQIIVHVEKENRIGIQFYKASGFDYGREFSYDIGDEIIVICEYVKPLPSKKGAG